MNECWEGHRMPNHMLTVISYVSLFLPTSNKPFLVLGVIRRDYDRKRLRGRSNG